MSINSSNDRQNKKLTVVSEEREQYIRSVELLIDVVRQLSIATDLEAIIEITCQAARALTGADGATFVLRDGDLSHYANEDAIGPLWKGKRFPLDSCIGGWCIANGKSVEIPDVFADDRIPAGVYEPTFIKSLAMVPIRQSFPLGAIDRSSLSIGERWPNRFR
jgi:GAF domain-containing protein